MRTRHLALRTEQVYLQWIRRFVKYHYRRHPREMGPAEAEAFLTHLAVGANVSASTQNQALQALLFLYRQVLDMDLPWLTNVTRAVKPKRLPVVPSRAEVRSLLAQLDGTPWLVANLLYGSGPRLMEGLRLRVKDLIIDRKEVIVRDAKGGKDRVTVLPAAIIEPLRTHLSKLGVHFERQRKQGEPGVSLPAALARKYPSYATQWGWQYVFPANSLCKDPYTGQPIRHRRHERTVQRAVQIAVCKARLTQPASCHTFRHLFRHALAGSRVRHSYDPGIIGSRRRDGHDDVHARSGQRSDGGQKPPRPRMMFSAISRCRRGGAGVIDRSYARFDIP
jgi:integron integrase